MDCDNLLNTRPYTVRNQYSVHKSLKKKTKRITTTHGPLSVVTRLDKTWSTKLLVTRHFSDDWRCHDDARLLVASRLVSFGTAGTASCFACATTFVRVTT